MIVAVDGLIGAGKSTLLNRLAAAGFAVWPEPVDDWGPLLERFYADPRRWALTLQLKILDSMSRIPEGPVLVERSPRSALVFLGNLEETGLIDAEELEVYRSFHARLAWEPDRTIYLDADPDRCLERIRGRNRPGEAAVDRGYLERLRRHYDRVLPEDTVRVRVDDRDPESLAREVEEILRSATHENPPSVETNDGRTRKQTTMPPLQDRLSQAAHGMHTGERGNLE